MKSSKTIFLALCILALPILGFAIPQVAVLDTILAAGIDKTVAVPVTDKIIEELVNSGKFKVIDRANVEQVLREKEFQLSSGIVKNEEVRQAGEYLGADLVVVANASRVGGTFVISAKMIDVVTGEIVAQASGEEKGSIDVLLSVARAVGRQIAGQPVKVAEKPAKEPAKVEEPKVEEKPPKEPVIEEEAEKPARVYAPARMVFGVRGGVNYANVSGEDWYFLYTDDFDLSGDTPYSMVAINAGAYLELNLSKAFAVDFELLYSQKGYNFDFTDWYWDSFFGWVSLGLVTNIWTFNYLEVPILLKIRLPAAVSPYVSIGASLAMLLGGSVESIYEDTDAQIIHDTVSIYGNPADIGDLPISIEDFDAGLVVGAGLDMSLGSVILNIDARYTMGLLSASGDFTMRNSALSVTAGVGFPF